MGISQGVTPPGGGINFTNPRYMGRWLSASSNLKIMDNAGSQTASSVAGFFTEAANRGLADSTNWTAATYKVILSTSTFTQVSAIIGPTGLAGTPTTTFEITINGVITVITVLATTTTQRAVLGTLVQTDNSTDLNHLLLGVVSMDAAKNVSLLGTANPALIPSWQGTQLFFPILTATQSLMIRMQTSESNSTTTNKESSSAVIYRTL